KTLDSRAVPYQPVASLTKVLWYGCELDEFDGDPSNRHQSLTLRYKKLIVGALTTDQPEYALDDVSITTAEAFKGPGTYKAEAQYTPVYDTTGVKKNIPYVYVG